MIEKNVNFKNKASIFSIVNVIDDNGENILKIF